MIWKQDRDPPYTRRDWIAARFEALGGGAWCDDLWRLCAHEIADTVTQILSGDGTTRGLGFYRSLWQSESETEPKEDIEPMSAAELEALDRASELINKRSRILRALARCNERIAGATYSAFHYNDSKKASAIRYAQKRRRRSLLAQLKEVKAETQRYRVECGIERD